VDVEESISRQATLRSQQDEQHRGMQLHSIPRLCQELGMGKSWIYQRLRSGEIPSIRLDPPEAPLPPATRKHFRKKRALLIRECCGRDVSLSDPKRSPRCLQVLIR
jgi:hypothetical protein